MSKAAPLSNDKRVENYQNQNGDKWLTTRQKRAIRKADRRAKKALKEKSDG